MAGDKGTAKIYRLFKDGLTNLVANLGTSRDKAAANYYTVPLMSEEQLLAAYRTSWLARKIVDIPAFDAIRKWRDWQASAEQITAIQAEEERLNIIGVHRDALVKARLFGGGAIYIGTGERNLMIPLEPERIGKGGLKFLTTLSRRTLSAGPLDRDPASPYYGKPAYYIMNETGTSVEIHPSRLVIFDGNSLPDTLVDGSLDGWGDSVLLSTLQAIGNADATAANVASLVFEAKVDVIRIPDFMAGLADPAYEARIKDRFGLAATGKGINGALLLDKDEEYEQKSANFTTLPDIIMTFLQIVSGAADIPATRLLGMTPGGLAATGESDTRNYYDRIASIQNIDIKPATYNLTECLIRSSLNTRPPEVHYIWSSLWQVSDKERADIGKLLADTIKIVHETALFPPEALANAATNAFVEASIFPGLEANIEEAGGLPDYEALMEEEKEAERAALEAKSAANSNAPVKRAANDAAPKTLYVRRDVINADAIASFYKRQGVKVMDAKKLHVTVIYSNAPVDWFAIGDSWNAEMTLSAGGARDHALFGPPGLENTLVLMIKSQELEWRHEAFKAAGAQTSYKEYQPHISLSYEQITELPDIKPWLGKIELGPEIFEEAKAD